MRDAATGKILWEQSKGWGDMYDREILARVPRRLLDCRAVSREVNFTSEFKMKDFRLEQRVLLHDRPFERWNFRFGFVMPGSTNTWQQVIEAADEMLPVEVLDGNVVIEHVLLRRPAPISQCRVRIFSTTPGAWLAYSSVRASFRRCGGCGLGLRETGTSTRGDPVARKVLARPRLAACVPRNARSATAFSPPLWRRIIFSAFARSRSNVKPVCSPLRASVNARKWRVWSRSGPAPSASPSIDNEIFSRLFRRTAASMSRADRTSMPVSSPSRAAVLAVCPLH